MRAVLIGGSSHAGKSTVGALVADRLNARLLSTDTLARHPGRPWSTANRAVPAHVVEPYATLEPDALLADVLRHYADNVWPLVQQKLSAAREAGESLIVDGSALWPDLVASLDAGVACAIYLTADDDLFVHRMQATSGYEHRSPEERRLIDKFLARTLLYNARMREAASRHGFRCIHVGQATPPQTVADEIIDVCSNGQ